MALLAVWLRLWVALNVRWAVPDSDTESVGLPLGVEEGVGEGDREGLAVGVKECARDREADQVGAGLAGWGRQTAQCASPVRALEMPTHF